MKHSAYTMLELVFVMIVTGILAIMVLPDFKTNMLQRAAEQVAGHVRYTQHLAIVDDKYDPADETWYKTRWQIRFLANGATHYYDVFSDEDKHGNSDAGEEAVDPLTRKRLGSGSTLNTPTDAVNLTAKYGISNIGGTCTIGGTKKLGFDYLGRPYLGVSAGVYSNPVPTNGCTITLQHPTEGTATITIAAETGYITVNY